MHHTNPPAARTLAWRILAALLLLGCGASALAGPPGAPGLTGPIGSTGPTGPTGKPAATALADPTRPPAALLATVPLRGTAAALPGSGTGVGTAATDTRGLASTISASLPTPVLQSVQMPLRGPAVAMVDGRLVVTGDTVGTRTVLSIDSQGLVLRGDGGTERLSLLGGNAKQAPGSITINRTPSFVAAPALDAAPLAQTERNPAGPPQLPNGGTMSLVGRIKP